MMMSGIIFAHGKSAEYLSKYIAQNEYKNILIIASSRVERRNELIAHIKEKQPGLKIFHFYNFTSDPTSEEIREACALASKNNVQAVIGLGGGTAIDIAKSVVLLKDLSQQQAEDQITSKSTTLPNKKCDLITIPTTSGSGSEATHFATIFVKGEKYSLASPAMLPDLSLVDADLCSTMPKSVAAACALDALCQAIESFWSVNATQESQDYAIRAIKLLFLHIEDAVLRKTAFACEKVAEGASLAGQAINISKTTAAHAYSYYLTTTHRVPHGQAVSMCFPAVALCNFHSQGSYLAPNHLMERFKHLFDLTQTKDINQFINWFIELANNLGLSLNLKSLGFNYTNEIQAFLNSVNLERLKNNPAKIDIDNFKKYIREYSG